MKKILFLFPLFLCLILPAFAQETKQISAEGVASVGSDPAAARDKAIEDALRRAVEQAVGTMVDSETAVENYQLLSDKIYTHSAGYVKSYKVSSETTEGNLVRVKIDAEVSSGELNNDLSGIGLLNRRMKYPRVMVMIIEQNMLNTDSYWNQYSVSNSQAESTVYEKLKAKGFNVVDSKAMRSGVHADEAKQAWDGNNEVAGRFSKRLGAEIVIVGEASSTRSANNIAGSDLLSVSTTITASAIKAGTGEIMAQSSSSGTAAHINEVAALQQAMQKASDKLADDLISGILKTWQQESSGTRALVMEVEDISQGELDKLKTSLEKMRGVTEVIVRNFSNGSAELNIQAKTDGQELSQSIAKTGFPGFKLVSTDVSVDRLEYRVAH